MLRRFRHFAAVQEVLEEEEEREEGEETISNTVVLDSINIKVDSNLRMNDLKHQNWKRLLINKRGDFLFKNL